MKVISRVGQPFYNFSLEKQEWKKGEKIGGFVLPFNIFDSVDGLFRRFMLWQSSNGVCLSGENHNPFWLGKYTMRTKTPVLVGDFVHGVSVLESECDYLDRLGLWECRVVYGQPPMPTGQEQKIDLLEGYAAMDELLAKELIELISGLFERAMPLCVCPANANLNTAPAQAVFSAAKKNAEQEIAQKIMELKEKLWH